MFLNKCAFHVVNVFCCRFIEVEEIHEPKLIVVVGTLGLIVNIVGLFLFAGTYLFIYFIQHYQQSLVVSFNVIF